MSVVFTCDDRSDDVLGHFSTSDARIPGRHPSAREIEISGLVSESEDLRTEWDVCGFHISRRALF